MIIRDITEKDIGDILSLIQSKAEFDGCIESLQSKETEIYDAFFSTEPKSKAIVAEIDNIVIGIATYYSIYSTFIAKPGIWLDDLFVYEEFRKTGAGKKLMVKLCEIAVNNGCGRIDWIVARDNQNGIAFYKSMGAQIFEEVRHSRLDENTIHKLLGL